MKILLADARGSQSPSRLRKGAGQFCSGRNPGAHAHGSKGVIAGFLALLAAPALFAQWPAYTPKAEPDLNGPAPKTADGKLDLSGIWEMPRRNGRQLAATPAEQGQTPLATFRDAGAGFKDGLPSHPGPVTCKSIVLLRTASSTRTLCVCPWDSCNSTPTASLEKSCRLRV